MYKIQSKRKIIYFRKKDTRVFFFFSYQNQTIVGLQNFLSFSYFITRSLHLQFLIVQECQSAFPLQKFNFETIPEKFQYHDKQTVFIQSDSELQNQLFFFLKQRRRFFYGTHYYILYITYYFVFVSLVWGETGRLVVLTKIACNFSSFSTFVLLQTDTGDQSVIDTIDQCTTNTHAGARD